MHNISYANVIFLLYVCLSPLNYFHGYPLLWKCTEVVWLLSSKTHFIFVYITQMHSFLSSYILKFCFQSIFYYFCSVSLFPLVPYSATTSSYIQHRSSDKSMTHNLLNTKQWTNQHVLNPNSSHSDTSQKIFFTFIRRQQASVYFVRSWDI